MSHYQICTNCIMDTSDPEITFDEEGVCSHCRNYYAMIDNFIHSFDDKELELQRIVKSIKEDCKSDKYDCVLGISGGVDSAYMAYVAKKCGLRVLAVHVDAGWNSEIAVSNIKKLCTALGIELHTIVVDWTTMKELQRAYMFSGLPNLDVPQDHAFIAAVYEFAAKYRIKYILNGSNFATEGILPQNWGYDAKDYISIKDVYKKCGRGKISLKKYPHMGIAKHIKYNYMGLVKKINLLNYIPYSKQMAINFLHDEYGWEYYGGKHFESRFTKWFQSYYLPRKFGYNKKRAHLSSLVVGGELSRTDALVQIEDTSEYPEPQMLEDLEYILKKLDITVQEWDAIMAAPCKTEDDYKNCKNIMLNFRKLKNVFK